MIRASNNGIFPPDSLQLEKLRSLYQQHMTSLKQLARDILASSRNENTRKFTMMIGATSVVERSNQLIYISPTEAYRVVSAPLFLAVVRKMNEDNYDSYVKILPVLRVNETNEKIHQFLLERIKELVLAPEIAVEGLPQEARARLLAAAEAIHPDVIKIWRQVYQKDPTWKSKEDWAIHLKNKKDDPRTPHLDAAFRAFEKLASNDQFRNLTREELDACDVWFSKRRPICTEAALTPLSGHNKLMCVTLRRYPVCCWKMAEFTILL